MTAGGRLLWFVADGLPFWLVEQAVARGACRGLGVLLGGGRLAPLRPAYPNCQTPPSLTALWSGLGPLESGVTGYDVPRLTRGSADPLGFDAAFQTPPDNVRWIWERYAADGQPVRLCHIPFVDPAALGPALITASYAFVPPAWSPSVAPVEAPAARGWRRTPRPDGGLGVLRDHRIGGRWTRIDLGGWRPRIEGIGAPDLEAAMSDSPCLARGLTAELREGRLGPTLLDGGDGRAEAVFASALEQLAERYYREFLYCVGRQDARLVVGYQPSTDLLLHELAGHLDRGARYWTPRREAVAWRLLLRMLASFEHFLGQLQGLLRADDVCVVCSDHGMAAIDTVVRPNVALRELGLLFQTPDGGIDCERSLGFLHPSETGMMCFNEATLARRQETRQSVVRRLADHLAIRGAAGLGWTTTPLGSRAGYDVSLFLTPGPRQQLKAGLAGPTTSAPRKTGDHVFGRDDPRLAGVLFGLGAGGPVPQDLDVSQVLAMVEAA